MLSRKPPSLLDLPNEILIEIIFWVDVSSNGDGPGKDLAALAQCCKLIQELSQSLLYSRFEIKPWYVADMALPSDIALLAAFRRNKNFVRSVSVPTMKSPIDQTELGSISECTDTMSAQRSDN